MGIIKTAARWHCVEAVLEKNAYANDDPQVRIRVRFGQYRKDTWWTKGGHPGRPATLVMGGNIKMANSQ